MEDHIDSSILRYFESTTLIIFDCDDVMYTRPEGDTESERTMLKVLRHEGVDEKEFSDAAFASLFAMEYHDGTIHETYRKRWGISYKRSQSLAAQLHDLKTIIPFEDLPPVLDTSLHKKAIATHSVPIWQSRLMPHLGLTSYFGKQNTFCHVDYDEERKDKSPRLFLEAMAWAGATPEQTVFIDDMEKNHVIARELGIRTVLNAPNFSGTIPAHINMVTPRPMELIKRIHRAQGGAMLKRRDPLAPSRPDIAAATHQLTPR